MTGKARRSSAANRDAPASLASAFAGPAASSGAAGSAAPLPWAAAGRRLTLAALLTLCALACLLAEAVSSPAATTQFGEQGSHSGQLKDPNGIAIDQASADVYVGDHHNWRIDKFDASGGFLRAWGWQVDEANPALELQTCTTECQAGEYGSGAGAYAIEGSRGLAVDNEPSSSSRGDLYVVDWENFRVQKFDSEGNFILTFGGGVNETSGEDVCHLGEACTAGTAGTGNGQFEWSYEGSYIAVGPEGDVYVGDKARVQVFEPSGAWKENISLAGLSREEEIEPGVFEQIPAQPNALAVDSAGDVFVAAPGIEGVREFEPDGTEESTRFDDGSFSVNAIALDPAGNVYVADTEGGFHILEYGPSGNQLASFGSNTVGFSPGAMAFADTSGRLYVTGNTIGAEQPRVFIIIPPPPGPLIESGSELGTAGQRGAATLEAQVNPEGDETTYHFEYVDQAHFQESGYATAASTAPASIGSGFQDQLALVELPQGTLVPGHTYHWRIVASNECEAGQTCTSEGADHTFEEVPPALVDGPWAADVASTSATLAARINPLGAATEYRLEYGTSTAYGQLLSGDLGEGEAFVPISFHRQDLEPSTTYHYRILTDNVIGTVTGADHTFTTQPAVTAQLALPDGRAWELVSPPNSKGALFKVRNHGIQAAGDGSAVTYTLGGLPLGENISSNNSLIPGIQTLSQRGPIGWRTENIDMPQSPPGEGENPSQLALGFGHYLFMSPDLTSAVGQPPVFTSLSSEGLQASPLLRDNSTQAYTPLLTPANTPAGTDLQRRTPPDLENKPQVKLVGGTPDLAHVILASPLKLTEEAEEPADPDIFYENGNLYEWSEGQLQLISRLPGSGAPAFGAFLAGERGSVPRVISDDGRRVAWTRGRQYDATTFKGLFLRDTLEGETVQIGGPRAQYQTMSADGSRVFYLEKGDLYEYDATSGAQTDLTANHGPGEDNAGVQQSVSNVSEDGSYVYFVATGVLAPGAHSAEDNLYLLRETGGQWSASYIATLSSADEHTWGALGGSGDTELGLVTSRVSPGGRFLAFMSSRPLTAYDNTDALSGQPDEEVYLYDALSAHLACVSCNPTGARPIGVFTGNIDPSSGSPEELLVEAAGYGAWSRLGDPHWLAGSLPAWQGSGNQNSVYQPRYLSDSGRLFFHSPDSLVPHDTNGFEDVYQYEPPGIGGCSAAGANFSALSDGCVDLISSGTSSAESAFLDASENGDDVFFITSDRLTAATADPSFHVWDAHVCSASAPCTATSVSPPPCSTGESCKPAPSPRPEVFGPAPSAAFSGAGNVHPARKHHRKKHHKKHRKHNRRTANHSRRAGR